MKKINDNIPKRLYLSFVKNADFIVESALILTALAGFSVSIFGRFFDIDYLKDVPSITLAIVSVFSVGVWGERKRTIKQLEIINLELKNLREDNKTENEKININRKILNFSEKYSKICQLRNYMDDRPIKEFHKFLNEYFVQLDFFSKGQINMPMREAPYANSILIDSFEERMDAVSDRDLEFWSTITGQDYYKQSIAVSGGRGTNKPTITRIFIFDYVNFENEKIIINKILSDHFNDKIGFAIIISDGLKKLRQKIENDKDGNEKLIKFDFALFDNEKAVSFFRKKEILPNNNERFFAVFSTKNKTHENNTLIKKQRELWKDLVCECWVASRDFVNSIENLYKEKSPSNPERGFLIEEKKYIESKTKNYNKILSDAPINWELEDKIFPIVIEKCEQIDTKIKLACDLFLKRNGKLN